MVTRYAHTDYCIHMAARGDTTRTALQAAMRIWLKYYCSNVDLAHGAVAFMERPPKLCSQSHETASGCGSGH